ncbi:MSMEG_1061 family FMN-dependent PPOX-type flavoprotein [Kitasatospora arboriphila]
MEIASEAELLELTGPPNPVVFRKAARVLGEFERRWLENSPFCLIATSAADGTCDVSPRGDPPGFVLVLDETTIAVPDRPGNRRLDSWRNVLGNPHVGLISVIPGRGDTLRINGRAKLLRDAPFFDRMTVKGNRPQIALVIDVSEAYFHCAKSFLRAASGTRRPGIPTRPRPGPGSRRRPSGPTRGSKSWSTVTVPGTRGTSTDDRGRRRLLSHGQLSVWRDVEGLPRHRWHEANTWTHWTVPDGVGTGRVRQALHALGARHQSLHTVYDFGDPAAPRQVLRPFDGEVGITESPAPRDRRAGRDRGRAPGRTVPPGAGVRLAGPDRHQGRPAHDGRPGQAPPDGRRLVRRRPGRRLPAAAPRTGPARPSRSPPARRNSPTGSTPSSAPGSGTPPPRTGSGSSPRAGPPTRVRTEPPPASCSAPSAPGAPGPARRRSPTGRACRCPPRCSPPTP